MDRNEFWALTGCSMSVSGKEDNYDDIKKKSLKKQPQSLRKKSFLSCLLSMTGEGLLRNLNSLKVLSVNR